MNYTRIYLPIILLSVISYSLSAKNYTIKTAVEDLQFEKWNGFDVISLPNTSFFGQEGAPMLPVKVLQYVVPTDKDVSTIRIISVKETVIKGSYTIYPKQPERITSDVSDDFTEPNAAFYQQDAVYPDKIIENSSTGFKSGTRICTFSFNPIRYNPVRKEISVVTEIEFELQQKDDVCDFVSSKKLSEHGYQMLLRTMQSVVENPDEITDVTSMKKATDVKTSKGRSYIATPNSQLVDQVIITNEALSGGFQAIADWKTKKGLPAKVVTVEWIEQQYDGIDLQEKIRNFIIYAYENWGTVWVLLGGDSDVVPLRYVWTSHCNYSTELVKAIPEGEFIPTDTYYACLDRNWNADGDMTFGEEDGNRNNNGTFTNTYYTNTDNIDWINDIIVGRIPVGDTTELNCYKAKYFDYVKSTTGNKNNLLFFSQNSEGLSSGQMTTVYNVTPTSKNRVRNYECSGYDYCATKDTVLSNMNGTNGTAFHLVSGFGHGSTKSLWACTDIITQQEIKDMTNTNTCQLLYTNHCTTLAYDKECIGEDYLINSHGGVAYIGNTRFGWSNNPSTVNASFINNIFNNGITNIGDAFYTTKSSYNYQNIYVFRWTFYSHNLAADPEMPVWTDNPDTLNVTLNPAAIILGEQTVTVTVSNLPTGQSAMICLQKGDEVYISSLVTANGTYNFTVNTDTPGTIDVTVTSQDFTPYEGVIYVNNTSAPKPYVMSVSYDDDMYEDTYGNDNGINDAGETVVVSLVIKNTGLGELARSSTATISCNSSDFSFVSTQTTFGPIPSGGTETIQYIYNIDQDAASVSVHDENPVIMSIVILDGNRAYTDEFNVELQSSEIEQGNKTIAGTSDSDLIIEAGDSVFITIDLTNSGEGQANLYATLSRDPSLDTNGYIAGCSSTERTYPPINKLETATSTTTFNFKVSYTYPGNNAALWFILDVRNEFGKTWTYSFNLLDKPSQIALSNLAFTPSATDTKVYLKTAVQSIKGYNFYRCGSDDEGSPDGEYEKINEVTCSYPFFTDMDVEALTTYWYKVSAVSLTGNEGPLSEAMASWSICPSEDGFPVRMDIEGTMRSSINVVDIDDDGHKEIFSVLPDLNDKGYIIGLNSDGTELFDIDDNPDTYSGFVQEDAELHATPAIGDLKHDGSYQVVTMTRDEDGGTNQTNYYYCHEVVDEDEDSSPDEVWQKEHYNISYRGAMIANVDNSEDGTAETICYTENGQICIYNYAGDTLSSFGDAIGHTYGALAVADIDGNGTKEVLAGAGNSITIWNYDGTLMNTITNTNYTFNSSIVAVDLDNDGLNEIVTSAVVNSTTASAIVAYDSDGTPLANWDGSQRITSVNNWHSLEISVGDLDNDGNIEVVANGVDTVKVWDYTGALKSSILLSNQSHWKVVPILADVDGDADMEIIVSRGVVDGKGYKGRIYAFDWDGTVAFGFPIEIDNCAMGSPCVADIDNDGLNEVIYGEYDYIHVHQTKGNADYIEWGSERHDYRNTGEYINCKPQSILSDDYWSKKDICADITVESGTLLTIGDQVNVLEHKKITVKDNAYLIIDGGKLLDASVEVQSGGCLQILNDGKLRIDRKGQLSILSGATFINEYGAVEKAH